MTTKTLTTVFDNEQAGDQSFILEEDADGLLYETSNANTRALVCGAMFTGWDCLESEEWLANLTQMFDGRRDMAERYQRAALDQDK